MRILAFDTATRATTVALAGAGPEPIEGRDDPPRGARPGHAGRLLPLAAELLDRAGIGWHELELLAVGIGPGTFTGLRIGVSTARALAQALTIPIAPVSTLRSLALNALAPDAPAPGAETVFAVLDARRGEVFTAAWRRSELDRVSEPQLAPRAMRPEALAELLRAHGSSALALGDGAVEFRAALEPSGASIPGDDADLHRVTAINHCRLAGSVRASAPEQIRPEYIRIPDAEISRRAAADE